MAKIEMGKTYKTRNGAAVRVLCVNIKSDNYPVVAAVLGKDGFEVIKGFTSDGLHYRGDSDSFHNLVEHNPWNDVAVDTKIFVRMKEHEQWVPRYFASYTEPHIIAWDDGKTSFTANGLKCHWVHAKVAE
jgi:hypothetical protein